MDISKIKKNIENLKKLIFFNFLKTPHKFAHISPTVRDRAKRKMFWEITCIVDVHSKKHKFAVTSETVRDRAKQSEFSTLVGLLHEIFQILKIFDF